MTPLKCVLLFSVQIIFKSFRPVVRNSQGANPMHKIKTTHCTKDTRRLLFNAIHQLACCYISASKRGVLFKTAKCMYFLTSIFEVSSVT